MDTNRITFLKALAKNLVQGYALCLKWEEKHPEESEPSRYSIRYETLMKDVLDQLNERIGPFAVSVFVARELGRAGGKNEPPR